MLVFTIDIEKKAAPIIKKVSNIGASAILTYAAPKGLKENLDDLILIIEGFSNHIQDLDKDQSTILLKQTKETFKSFVEMDELLHSLHYFNDNELKEQFQYSLNTLSKFKSVLHIYLKANKPVNKPPDHFKVALSKISRASTLCTIQKKSL